MKQNAIIVNVLFKRFFPLNPLFMFILRINLNNAESEVLTVTVQGGKCFIQLITEC